MTTAKLMKFKIPIDILLGMLTTGKVTQMQCVTGMPIGTRYISSYVDTSTMLVHLVVEHSSYKELEIGEMIPEVTIKLAEINPKANFEIPVNLLKE